MDDNKYMLVDENYTVADIIETLIEGYPRIITTQVCTDGTIIHLEIKEENVKTTKDKAERALQIFENHWFRNWKVIEVKTCEV